VWNFLQSANQEFVAWSDCLGVQERDFVRFLLDVFVDSLQLIQSSLDILHLLR
jgi:hypothetical protein